MHLHAVFFCGDFLNIKGKYIASAGILLISSIIVKFISAVYKIPLTAYIGAVGRGYYTFAYNLVMPVHAVTMGAFPVALSKLISKYSSLNNHSMVTALRKGSLSLFSLVGFISMLLLMLLSKPYSDFIVKSPDTVYTALVLAPSVLFSCISASYRGYFEGKINMIPTAVSQVIEALFKMVFGLFFAKISVAYLLSQYDETSCVMGISVSTYDDALALIYPFSTAFSMLGVTLGCFASLCYLYAYSLFKSEKPINTDYKNIKAKKMILTYSFPIMLSTCVQSVFQFLDTASIQYALNHCDYDKIRQFFSDSLSYANVLDKDLPTFACGIHSSALDFKNLVPGITMALGVSAVPVISSLFETGNKSRLKSISDSIFKYTFIISVLGGIILYFCSDNLLNIMYADSSPEIVKGSLDIIKYYSLGVPCFSLAGIAVFSVQALGKAEKSIPSYIFCGIIRCVLNILLIENTSLLIYGAVISCIVSYALMTVWNVIIYMKYAKIKLSIPKCFVLPSVLQTAAIIAVSYIFNRFDFAYNDFVLIVLKTVIIIFVCLIFCFLCGLLNFKDIFRYLGHKKAA